LIRAELKLTIAATIPNKTAAAPPPMIVTAGTHKIINIMKSLGCPVLPADQTSERHEAATKAAIAPKIAPHSTDLPTMLLLMLCDDINPTGCSKEQP